MKSNKEVLEMIARDMKEDAEKFDGQPFNGKIVAEYLGNLGAAMAALANIVKSILEQPNDEHIGFCMSFYEKESCADCPTLKGCLELRNKERKEKNVKSK